MFQLIPDKYQQQYEKLQREQRQRVTTPGEVWLDPIECLPIEPGIVTGMAGGNWAHHFYSLPKWAEWIEKTAKRPVLIVVFDTAGEYVHESLEPYIIRELDESFTGEPKADGHGHGTHVASCYAGKHPDGLHMGPASLLGDKVKIAAAKVLRNGGNGSVNDIVGGSYEMAKKVKSYQNKGWAIIFNYSLGAGGRNAQFDAMAENLENKDILVLAAAGNSGSESVSTPANAASAHAIAAINSDGSRASFSSYGEDVYLSAPGVRVFGAWRDGYVEASGTSMATPVCGGMFAIWASVFPKANMRQLSHAGRFWATDLKDVGWDRFTGYGHLNVDAMQKQEPTRFPAIISNGNPTTFNPDPRPIEQPPKHIKRELNIIWKTPFQVTWQAANIDKVEKSFVEIEISVKTDAFAPQIADELKIATDLYFKGAGLFMLPKNSDFADAAYHISQLYALEMRRQGFWVRIRKQCGTSSTGATAFVLRASYKPTPKYFHLTFQLPKDGKQRKKANTGKRTSASTGKEKKQTGTKKTTNRNRSRK